MKKTLVLIPAAAALFMAGCASSIPMGTVYTDVKLPVSATANVDTSNLQVGRSTCKSFVGVVAVGDASIEAAKKNGGIKKVVFVDWKAKSTLGIVGEYECIVYGE